MARQVNAVCEGRDLGTVVFPEAELKIFLTGDVKVRAMRRMEEFKIKFPDLTSTFTLQKAIEEIEARDLYDSTREHSPLKKAADAVVIDTTDLTIDQVVEKVLELTENIRKRL